MDHRELDDLWDYAVFRGTEPRYARVKQVKKPVERFAVLERPRALGFASPIVYTGQLSRETRRERLAKRPLAKSPFRVLDAPSVLNDYYLNVLDWSSEDIIALGLSDHLYLWNARTRSVQRLTGTSESNYVAGLAFSPEGLLAMGTSEGRVEIFDLDKKKIMDLPQRNCRVPSLAWGPGILSVGAKDGSIFNYDIRSGEHVSSFLHHTQEVCGLRWDGDMNYLASGSNDNNVCVWRNGCTRPRARLEKHTAAVRALAWCPWKKGVLATGGGTDDRTIRSWDVEKEVCLSSVDTGSQVCSLAFSEKYKEIISTHGYSDNSVGVWKFCTMRKIGVMEGHTDRVLYSALSPDGNVLATCAADENLNFWQLFESPTESKGSESSVSMR
ncbi:cell division cycle 20, cofactor of APC complex [Nematocida homosporus]|uniref:cell division cycle 20, cofactor of APC complex n=1 Tax=Nematocida homosporus TaxID=1912981 RepID=UPI00221E90A8|nr:cell division cycle 20, cofactor of APC complex [Nematocida homosporus]KAI5184284.1 cell division cycle 20, cofactor of APC complex [Nematocida homosporus]